MISEEEARAGIVETLSPLPAREVPLLAALDCFAAEDYFACLTLPLFDNSAMDGYAVIAADCGPGKRLPVVGEQPAGQDRQLQISFGQAVRIFTGAPMPAGADAVVMQEDVTAAGNEIVINTDVDPGEFVRKRGCDLSEGQKIVSKGDRIGPIQLALLASQGHEKIMIGGEVTASVVSTGDELAKPGGPLQAGEIYDSNSVLLEALLKRCGAIVKSVEHCPDKLDLLVQALERAGENRVLLITGGVSVGEHDLVRTALQSLGARIDVWRVAIKPGKPFLSGKIGDCTVFGLPGNPVSAFVTFLQLVRPAIWKLMGATNLDLPTVRATLAVDLTNDGDRAHYFRGRIDNGTFAPVGRQESHALFGLSQSNALLRLAPGETIERGATVDVHAFN